MKLHKIAVVVAFLILISCFTLHIKAETGTYGMLFNDPDDSLKGMLYEQLGQLAIMTIHPTCNYQGTSMSFHGRSQNGTLRTIFISNYSGLLIGKRKAVWEFVFDDSGEIFDFNLISDSSPLTNVSLINTVKKKLIDYVKSQMRNFPKK